MKAGKIPSQMQHQFSQVPKADIPRSSFDRSHGYKTAFNAGALIPFFVDEALPGDTFNLETTAFARLATPIFPIMDNLYLDTQFFAVPIRLLWENWQKFNGEQDSPGDSTDFVVPIIDAEASGYANETIYDYMGLPTKIADFEHSALWLRAYNLIWNEWYRDQNMQNPATINVDDGPDLKGDYQLLPRGKRHDYFTSALPWPQKGDSVELPFADTAPVVSTGGFVPTFKAGVDGSVYGSMNQVGTTVNQWTLDATNSVAVWLDPGLEADLSSATAATINQLREAFQVQKLLERDARGGTRYTEIILSHFGVSSPDSRLQRPEYLGGGTTNVNINPVAQTTSTDATSPQGNLAAIGTAQIHNHGFTKSFTEHCVLIGLVSLRADLTYQQGLDRMWSRSTRFDFYWPALAHIGEQAVLNKEIFTQGIAADEDVFGYQERYAEYRYKPSKITGVFRSNDTGSLDAWHLAQDFASLPVLNNAFISDDPPIDRIIAVQTEPHVIFDSYIKMRCVRPMPIYGVPGFVDHF